LFFKSHGTVCPAIDFRIAASKGSSSVCETTSMGGLEKPLPPLKGFSDRSLLSSEVSHSWPITSIARFPSRFADCRQPPGGTTMGRGFSRGADIAEFF
jgi:hypothetical protein